MFLNPSKNCISIAFCLCLKWIMMVSYIEWPCITQLITVSSGLPKAIGTSDIKDRFLTLFHFGNFHWYPNEYPNVRQNLHLLIAKLRTLILKSDCWSIDIFYFIQESSCNNGTGLRLKLAIVQTMYIFIKWKLLSIVQMFHWFVFGIGTVF